MSKSIIAHPHPNLAEVKVGLGWVGFGVGLEFWLGWDNAISGCNAPLHSNFCDGLLVGLWPAIIGLQSDLWGLWPNIYRR